jgi:hypothetical protein
MAKITKSVSILVTFTHFANIARTQPLDAIGLCLTKKELKIKIKFGLMSVDLEQYRRGVCAEICFKGTYNHTWTKEFCMPSDHPTITNITLNPRRGR